MIFSFSELWGPFVCEVPGCTDPAWDAFLTDDDVASLPEDEHPARTNAILQKGIGTMVCERHLPKV